MENNNENCHGCKWLDEVENQPPGSGYCCQVVRQSGYKPARIVDWRLVSSDKVRRPENGRCELYKAGNFATRYEDETHV